MNDFKFYFALASWKFHAVRIQFQKSPPSYKETPSSVDSASETWPRISISSKTIRHPTGASTPAYECQYLSQLPFGQDRVLTPGNFNLYPGATFHRILLTNSKTAIFICSNTNACPKHFLICALNGIKVPLIVSLLNFSCISSTLKPHRSGMKSWAFGPQLADEVWTP